MGLYKRPITELKVSHDPDGLRAHTNEQPHLWKNAKVEEVPIDKLHATQKDVYPSRVKAFEQGKAWDFIPNVDHKNGKYYLIRGHHRVIAAKLKGAKDVPVKVIDH